MKKWFLALLVMVSLGLSGCMTDTALVKAEQTSDSVLAAAEKGICSAPLTALIRNYGDTAERWDQLVDFCFGDAVPYVKSLGTKLGPPAQFNDD